MKTKKPTTSAQIELLINTGKESLTVKKNDKITAAEKKFEKDLKALEKKYNALGHKIKKAEAKSAQKKNKDKNNYIDGPI